jgi:putative ABC transport system permease protein
VATRRFVALVAGACLLAGLVPSKIARAVQSSATPVHAALPDVVLTDRTAARLGVAVGDTVEIAANAALRDAGRFVVGGIYRPHADPFEVGNEQLHVTLHLPDLERLMQVDDRVDRFTAKLRDPAEATRVADEINALRIGVAAYTSQQLADANSSTFVVISQFHKAIGVVSMFAGLVFLIAIMVLKVEEMRRVLGVLRLIGISRRTVLRSVLLIAALVSLFGSVVGIGLAHIAVAIINPASQARYDTDLIFAHITPGIVVLAVGLAIPMGLLAGWLVARRIVHGKPLDQIGR